MGNYGKKNLERKPIVWSKNQGFPVGVPLQPSSKTQGALTVRNIVTSLPPLQGARVRRRDSL